MHGGHAAYVLAPDAWRTEKVCSKRLAFFKMGNEKIRPPGCFGDTGDEILHNLHSY